MNIESCKGNIYTGISNWRFIIIRDYTKLRDKTKYLEIKILNRPDFPSSCDVIKGHAVIHKTSLKNCKIITGNNIMEYLKIMLIY